MAKQLNLFEYVERLEKLYWQAVWELTHLWLNAAHLFCDRTGVGYEHVHEISEELPLLAVQRYFKKRPKHVSTIDQAKNVLYKFVRRHQFHLAQSAAERLGLVKRCQVKGQKLLVRTEAILDVPAFEDSSITLADLLAENPVQEVAL